MLQKIKWTIFTFIFSCLAATGQQPGELAYFVKGNGDTTFCEMLIYYTNAKQQLRKLDYTTVNGEKKSIKGTDKVPDVSTFFWAGSYIDKVPQNADQPQGHTRYCERTVNGKLKVYFKSGENRSWRKDSKLGWPSNTPSREGIDWFYLKMPDGTYYDLRRANTLNGEVKQYLVKCTAFKNAYEGNFSTDPQPFMEMIELYNERCD